VTVSAFVPDLMDKSKVQAAFPDATFARRVEALSDASLVIVDLGRDGAIEAVKNFEGRIVGFASHVDEILLEQAKDVGIEAIPRSLFFRRLGEQAL
jgi:hypothetical protein